MSEFFQFQLRTRVLCKPGLLREVGPDIAQLGAQRAFIVADAGVAAAGLLDLVRDALAGHITIVGVFTDVPPNSSVASVEAGAAQARAVGADLLIGLGGGSPIDTAKAMRILITEGGTLRDHQGYNLLNRPLVPMIAIPTTSGTGSEVTSWAVIRDEDAQVKMTFSSSYLEPELALLDPELTRGLPPKLTAATGVDALTHAIESYVGNNANPFTDAFALQAITLIGQHLRTATDNGDDMAARAAMLNASCIAGIAYSCGGGSLGVVHALAHSVGGLFGVHHGTANAILLPHGMRFNAPAVPTRFRAVATALGVAATGRADDTIIDAGVAAVVTLLTDCGLPLRLRDVGVPLEALEDLAELAISDPAVYTNPRPVSVPQAYAIAQSAW